MTNSLPINPASHRLGTTNSVVGSAGIGAYHVRAFTGPLSIKVMLQGSGVWRTDAGVHHVEEGHFLILNHGQTYALDIDSRLPRESFCPFFRTGFVEDMHRTLTCRTSTLLDDPANRTPPLTFHEHLHPGDNRVLPAVLALRRLAYDPDAEPADLEDAFVALGEALIGHALHDLPAQIARVPAARAATRAECHRRLAIVRDLLHAAAHQPLRLEDMAAHAELSPYHLHRCFKAVHGLTPQQYLTRVRLDRARRLLRDSDLPVIDVALAVGFESHAAFTRRFTRWTGQAPSRYRAGRRR